eukprot:scaffold190414_cov16-Tisochrysis_lutea.AAC.1
MASSIDKNLHELCMWLAEVHWMGLKRSSKESSRLASQALFCLSAQLTFCLFVPFPRAARWLSEQTNC